jgi:hypothetical protein
MAISIIGFFLQGWLQILFTFGTSITSWKLTLATSGLFHFKIKETVGFEYKLHDIFLCELILQKM